MDIVKGNYLREELYDLVKKDESIFDFIQEVCLDGMWYWDIEKPENEWMNARFWQVLGYNPAEMPHTPSAWQGIINLDDLKVATDNFHRHLSDENYPYDQTVRYTHKQGHIIWIRCYGKAIRDQKGTPLRMLGIHQNITALREEQIKLQTILEDSGVGYWEMDISTGATIWSEMVYSIHEVPKDFEHHKENGLNFYHPDYREIISNVVSDCINNDTPFSLECILITGKGNQKWVKASGRKVGDKLLGGLQDITSIKNNELKFKGIFNSTFSFIGFMNTKGILLEANDTALNMAGLQRGDVIGKYFWDCYWWQISTKTQQELKANFQRVLSGETLEYEVAVWIANQSPITILFSLKPIFDEKGNVIYIIPEGRPIQEIIDTRRKYKSVIEGTLVGTWEWNVQTGETVFNERWAEMLGYTLEELAPISIETWMMLAHPEDLEESSLRLNVCFQQKSEFYEMESRMKHKSGHWVWVYDRGKVFEWTEDGKPLMMYGTHQDISKRKDAEQLKNQVLERFELIGQHIPGVIYQFQLNPDGSSCFPYASTGIENIYGLTPDQVKTDASFAFKSIYPADLEKVTLSIQESASNLTQWRDIYRTILPSGKTIWVEGNATPYKNTDGSIIWHGYIQDITIRKQKEEALTISEVAFRGNFENAAIGMALLDQNGKWLEVNARLCKIVGYSEVELKNLTFQDITHPEDLNADLSFLNELIKGERSHYQMEKRYFHKKGHIVYIMLAVSMVKDKEGNIVYFISQIIDISMLKRAEMRLKALLAENQALMEATTEVAFVSTDKDGVILNTNVGVHKLLGFEAKQLVGQSIKQILFLDEEWEKASIETLKGLTGKEEDRELLNAFANDSRYKSKEWTFKQANGSTIDVLISITEIKLENLTKGYLFAATDISHIKSIQGQLEQKNEELEQFAYIAAHDLKEPLRGITTYLSILQKRYGELLDEKANSYIDNAYNNANRMKELITDILDFSKTGNIDDKPIELNALLNSIISNYKNDVKLSKVIFTKSSLPVIKGDASSFVQLFTNLIDNGIKYQPKGQVSEINIDWQEDEKCWTFSVADNGIGIAPEHQNKVFEIFKRLHSDTDYSGTGIGLASCKKIISAYQGKIWFESNIPQGTVFKFTIPKS
ncbi:PAS domain-containing sensor histidine kinase [Belliella aquatica]|uniref:histidine kinase n=1 Tax=Belliella aquatica TaxID=1323734 RepID=A0ABQ1LRJ9_9BACT|nr:PAS domain S-box protein [Belliella aquatica]MCH7404310.1 PAS domain S-box protein [Belliella aquatica]GGC26996.1 hypothetical protein GCM10010993_02580 [Belliella aquatica]